MQRTRYLNFSFPTSIGVLSGSISVANILFEVGGALQHGVWSTPLDLKLLFTGTGLRTDEAELIAKELIDRWKDYEQRRKNRSRRHAKS